MEGLPEPLEPHGSEHYPDWKSRIADHGLWVLSRTLVVIIIVVVAYFARVPFQRLLVRDVVVEMEEKQKEKLLEEFNLVNDLAVGGSNFAPIAEDSARAVVEYERSRTPASKETAERSVHDAVSTLDILKRQFKERHALLDMQFEAEVHQLIEDGENGIRLETRILSSDNANELPYTFDGLNALITMDVKNLDRYEQVYVQILRSNPNALARTE